MKKSLLLILTVLFFSLTACDLLNETVDENDLSAISLNGDKTIDIEVNTEYTDLGVEAVGILGEILTYEVEGTVDTNLLGEYVLTYKAYYSDEDYFEISRTIRVVDTTPPTINVEITEFNIDVLSEFSLPTITCSDNYDAECTYEVIGFVDTNFLGEYTIKIEATDSSLNKEELSYTFTVVDTVSPIISLIGEEVIEIIIGDNYQDEGINVEDNFDLFPYIVIENEEVDTSVLGTTVITYTVTDLSGNESVITRTVTVVEDDTEAYPVITIGSFEPIIEVFDGYTLPVISCTDDVDAECTAYFEGVVNVDVLGEYNINVVATDADGHTTVEVITYTVVDLVAPYAELSGDNPVVLFVGDDFFDYGVADYDNYDFYCTITIGGDTVDTSTEGIYIIEYTVTDSSGNFTVITRTVEVYELYHFYYEAIEEYIELGEYKNAQQEMDDLFCASLGDPVVTSNIAAYKATILEIVSTNASELELAGDIQGTIDYLTEYNILYLYQEFDGELARLYEYQYSVVYPQLIIENRFLEAAELIRNCRRAFFRIDAEYDVAIQYLHDSMTEYANTVLTVEELTTERTWIYYGYQDDELWDFFHYGYDIGEYDDLYIYFYFTSTTEYVHDFQVRIYDSITNSHILTYDYYWGPPIRTLTGYDVEADTYISEITVVSSSFDDPSLFLNLFDYLSEGYYIVEFFSESGTSLGSITGENKEEADILYALGEAYLFDFYDPDYYYDFAYFNN